LWRFERALPLEVAGATLEGVAFLAVYLRIEGYRNAASEEVTARIESSVRPWRPGDDERHEFWARHRTWHTDITWDTPLMTGLKRLLGDERFRLKVETVCDQVAACLTGYTGKRITADRTSISAALAVAHELPDRAT
jgi:hypothetical protein